MTASTRGVPAERPEGVSERMLIAQALIKNLVETSNESAFGPFGVSRLG